MGRTDGGPGSMDGRIKSGHDVERIGLIHQYSV
jgi:hypothetical protein